MRGTYEGAKAGTQSLEFKKSKKGLYELQEGKENQKNQEEDRLLAGKWEGESRSPTRGGGMREKGRLEKI